MKRYLLGLSVVAAITASLLVQGCAKTVSATIGRGTAVAPANIKAVANTGTPNNGTAVQVANVALYYALQSLHNPSDYSSMLAQDGGCQMASDYSDAIGSNDLLGSVTAYCTSPAPQTGAVNCTQAKADAQTILTTMQNLNNLCATSTDANPYGFGDPTSAAALFTAGNSFRADLGMAAAQ